MIHFVQGENAMLEEKTTQESLEEFSIMELDDRLEFVAWCDTNCNCGKQPQQPQTP